MPECQPFLCGDFKDLYTTIQCGTVKTGVTALCCGVHTIVANSGGHWVKLPVVFNTGSEITFTPKGMKENGDIYFYILDPSGECMIDPITKENLFRVNIKYLAQHCKPIHEILKK